MSKQYKGWEIAKMIYEGTLKDGDKILNEGNRIFYVSGCTLRHGQDATIRRKGDEIRLSWITNNESMFTIVQQPVSFMEIVKSCKKCKVKHELIDTDLTVYGNKKISDFNDLDWVLFTLTNNQIDIKTIIQEGKWYIESEADSNDIR